MKLLNLGCGGDRHPEPWVNVDNLFAIFEPGRPERTQLHNEPNYVNADITKPLPFPDETFNVVLFSHCLEHFPAQQGLKILMEIRRVLKTGCSVIVSVPDASYFRTVFPEDRNENWPRLFDTTDPKNPIPTFFEAALFFNEHDVILTEDAVWCYLKRAGFDVISNIGIVLSAFYESAGRTEDRQAACAAIAKLNRLKFSLIMEARK